MDCETVNHLLPTYVDSELSHGTATEIQSHLAVCPACQEEAAFLQRLSTAMESLPRPAASGKLNRRIRKAFRIEVEETFLEGRWNFLAGYMDTIIYGLAVAGFLVGLFLGTSFFSFPNTPHTPDLIAYSDTEGMFR